MKSGKIMTALRGGEAARWLSASPALVLGIVFLGIPGIWLIIISFYRDGPSFAGYQFLLTDELFAQALVKTLFYSLSAVFLQVLLGAVAAIWVHRFAGKSRFVLVSLFLPYVVPSVVAVVMWRFLLEEGGLLGELAGALLGEEGKYIWMGKWVLASLMIVSVWQFYPFVFVAVLARLRQIPKGLFLNSELDGASFWQQFRFVIYPEIRSTLIAVSLLRLVFMMTKFDTPWLLGGRSANGDISVLAIYVYENGFRPGGIYGSAGAAAIVIAIISALVLGCIFLVAVYRGGSLGQD